jgi:hypothetical protein
VLSAVCSHAWVSISFTDKFVFYCQKRRLSIHIIQQCVYTLAAHKDCIHIRMKMQELF